MKEVWLAKEPGEISHSESFSSGVNIYLKHTLLDYTGQPWRMGKAVMDSVVRITIIIVIIRSKV